MIFSSSARKVWQSKICYIAVWVTVKSICVPLGIVQHAFSQIISFYLHPSLSRASCETGYLFFLPLPGTVQYICYINPTLSISHLLPKSLPFLYALHVVRSFGLRLWPPFVVYREPRILEPIPNNLCDLWIVHLALWSSCQCYMAHLV